MPRVWQGAERDALWEELKKFTPVGAAAEGGEGEEAKAEGEGDKPKGEAPAAEAPAEAPAAEKADAPAALPVPAS